MFKIFVAVYLASTGAPVAGGKSDRTYDTREACEVSLVSHDTSNTLSPAFLKKRIEDRIHQAVVVKTTCEKVDDQGESEDRV
jgi:hypothetical protein